MYDGGAAPGVSDQALTDLLGLHNLAMSGGLLSALDLRTPEGVLTAVAGYRHFGLHDAADVWQWLIGEVDTHDPDREPEFFEVLESEADRRYAAVIPTDDTIVQAFQQHFKAHPEQYAPLQGPPRRRLFRRARGN